MLYSFASPVCPALSIRLKKASQNWERYQLQLYVLSEITSRVFSRVFKLAKSKVFLTETSTSLLLFIILLEFQHSNSGPRLQRAPSRELFPAPQRSRSYHLLKCLGRRLWHESFVEEVKSDRPEPVITISSCPSMLRKTKTYPRNQAGCHVRSRQKFQRHNDPGERLIWRTSMPRFEPTYDQAKIRRPAVSTAGVWNLLWKDFGDWPSKKKP